MPRYSDSSSDDSTHDSTPLCEEDATALRKLRDSNDALKEYFGDGEDLRVWKGGLEGG